MVAGIFSLVNEKVFLSLGFLETKESSRLLQLTYMFARISHDPLANPRLVFTLFINLMLSLCFSSKPIQISLTSRDNLAGQDLWLVIRVDLANSLL